MRKKSGLIILVLVIVLQLCVPVGMIIYKTAETNTIVENGELFKFKIDSMTYRKGTLDFDIPLSYGEPQYALITTDSSGYAQFVYTDTEPQDSIYIKSSDEMYFYFPVCTIKTEKYEKLDYVHFFEKTGEEDWWDYALSNREIYNHAYLEAYVYKGKVIPVGVYIDGVEANTYLSRMNEEKQ